MNSVFLISQRTWLFAVLISMTSCGHSIKQKHADQTQQESSVESHPELSANANQAQQINRNVSGAIDVDAQFKWVPFFLESAPQQMDPRKGIHGLPPAPISAQELKKIFHETLAPLMFDLSGARFSGNLSMNDILMMMAGKIQNSLISSLERVDSQLNEQDAEFSLVLLPWKEDARLYSRQGIQIADQVQGRTSFGQPLHFYSNIEQNIKAIQRREYTKTQDPLPVFFLGVIMNIRLKKNQSSIRTQVMLGLRPLEKPFSQENEQIVFTHFGVPPAHITSDGPVLSAELSHYVRIAQKRPTLSLEFGPIKGWNSRIGQLRMELGQSSGYCEGQDVAVPYLKGKLGSKAVPREWLARRLEGFPVSFGVAKVDMDLISFEIREMDLAIGADFSTNKGRIVLGCVNSQSIDQQFQEEANKAIRAQILSQRETALGFFQSLMGPTRRGGR